MIFVKNIFKFFYKIIKKYKPLFLQRKITLISLIILVLLFGAAVFEDQITPYDAVRDVWPHERLQPPSSDYFFGTDNLGRDVFSRTVAGARVSITVGFLSVLLSIISGIIFGSISGYFSKADNIIMRVMDGMMAFPSIVLALALMAVLGPSLYNVILAIGIVYTPRTARLVRGQVLSIKEKEFVESAEAIGLSSFKILYKHIVPNCLSPIIVQATFTCAWAIQAEASLSFLGAGVPPGIPTWGIMLNEARMYMTRAPWMTIPPGVAISITILCFNALGDGLRDFLDPRYKDSSLNKLN